MTTIKTKSTMKTIDVDELANRTFEFEKGGKTTNNVKVGDFHPTFGRTVMKSTAILMSAVAVLSVGNQLTKGWNAEAAAPTVAVEQVKQDDTFKLYNLYSQKLTQARQNETRFLLEMQRVQGTLKPAALTSDLKASAEAFQQAAYALDDFQYAQLANMMNVKQQIIDSLDGQKYLLEKQLAGARPFGETDTSESRLHTSFDLHKQILDLESQIYGQKTELAGYRKFADDLRVEYTVASGAAEFLTALDNYESGEKPNNNHYASIAQYDISQHAKRMERLQSNENGLLAISKDNFSTLVQMNDKAMHTLEQDATQDDFMSIYKADKALQGNPDMELNEYLTMARPKM